ILIVFGLIAVVAIFNIVSSLMMIVIEKTKDIGVLKSMGVNNRQITLIFLFEGVLVGIAGTILGYIIAWFIAWMQMRFGIVSIPKDVYFMSKLPILLCWKDFLFIGLGALLFSVIATVYPSLKAVKLSPSEALRYE
ncbi:MAG: FtsX-like permease family protein, partial [Candidatus Marinimicrobia bacterium]|nr:FtsX-like permease family protein [Candidatus Neomarinimicrobiota bacterium]